MKTIKFYVFDEQGGFCDGDLQYFGRKGIGYIQIEPMPNVKVSLSYALKPFAK